MALDATDGRKPFSPGIYLVLPDILLACIVAANPNKSWRLAFSVAFTILTIHALSYTTGDKLQDYSTGSTLSGQVLTACYLLLFTKLVDDFQYISDSRPLASLSFWKRIYWAACIIHSPRGIGWNYQAPHLPPPPTVSRLRFVTSRLWRAVGCFLLVDIAQSYIHTNPLFQLPMSEAVSITSQGYLRQCLNIIAWGCTPYGMMTMSYYIIGAASVAFGISEPKVWVDPYGRWKDAYTVRRFWGRTWHQMLRRYVSAFGKFVATSLGCKKGTRTSSYVQLYIGFFVSGIMHTAGGDAMVGFQYLGASLPFFLVQPVAITVEDAVIGIARRRGMGKDGWSSMAARWIGYVWVFGWFSVSTCWYIDWAVFAGLGHEELLPASPVRYMLRLLGILP